MLGSDVGRPPDSVLHICSSSQAKSLYSKCELNRGTNITKTMEELHI
jgi:hypothetical protein